MVRKLFLVAVLIVVLLVLFRVVALTKVPCGFVGIRRPQLAGSGAGRAKPKLLMPGVRFAVPIVHQVDLVSTRVRKVDVEHVEVNLRDNLRVYVDATTTFRVEPTQLALNYALNDGEQYVQRAMLNDIKSVMRRFFQETNTDGFLEASWRTEQKAAIERQLSELLANRGVSLVHFFMRDFAFAASSARGLAPPEFRKSINGQRDNIKKDGKDRGTFAYGRAYHGLCFGPVPMVACHTVTTLESGARKPPF
ncbi:MAG TPA: SPFH domain-containing protein [bacterium]|nr:SPFH domain-containing protein [bacterium]